MRALLIACLLILLPPMAGVAFSSAQSAAEQIVELTAAGHHFEPLPSMGKPPPRVDHAKHSQQMSEFAVAFLVKELSEKDLEAILAFYQSPSGSRFLRLDDMLEAELMGELYAEAASPPPPSAATEQPTASDAKPKTPFAEARVELARKLIASPVFQRRVNQHAARYEKIRSGGKTQKPTKKSRARVDEAYVDLYSHRFVKQFLEGMVDFFTSPVGDRYATAQEKLSKALQKEFSN